MAIFRQFNPIDHDRAVEDKRRHRELVQDSIKKNLADILSDQSIIGQSKNKKVKVPIKGLKEYQFVYGKNVSGTGSGTGSEKRGDKIGSAKQQGKGKGKEQAGNQEGEDIYETEVSIEDVLNTVFEDLDLPDLDKKKFSEVVSPNSIKKSGYQRNGIRPRFAKKRTVVEKLKRKQGVKRAMQELNKNEEMERFPFKEDDLRYHRIKQTTKREYNAVIMCIMDTSASMSQTKKYLARSFYFLLYKFVTMKYTNVDVVFISHSTIAKVVNEDEFFHKGQSGGTYISSGYKKALDVIAEDYSPSMWNIYTFHVSDGDNWSEDNKRAVETAKKLCDVSNLFGYVEVIPTTSYSSIKKKYEDEIGCNNFLITSIKKKEDLWDSLKEMLKKDRKKG